MSKNNVPVRIPAEFNDFLEDLSGQISKELCLPKNKAQTMRMLADNYKGKIIYKDKKFDLRLF